MIITIDEMAKKTTVTNQGMQKVEVTITHNGETKKVFG